MKKLILILISLMLCSMAVNASVNTVASGIFKGSERNIVTFDEPIVYVDGVAGGDFISVTFPDKKYSINGYEKKSFYVRRINGDAITYDFDLDKFNEIVPGDIVTHEIDGQKFTIEYIYSQDRKGYFRVALGDHIPNDVIEEEIIKPEDNNEDIDTIKTAPEEEQEIQTEDVKPEKPVEDNLNEQVEETSVEPKKSFWQWLIGLFK